MSAPHLLDLYSGAGGAAVGYARAGFRVTGVDVRPMPRYPYDHIHADATEYLDRFSGVGPELGQFPFDAVHASPPCQGHSRTARFGKYVWPELIGPTRERLDVFGVPYVIENVRGAPLIHDPTGAQTGVRRWVTELCGCMFPGQMFTYRERLFETNFYVEPPPHVEHVARVAKLGRRPLPGEFMHVIGNPVGADESRRAMGIDWMQRRELCEAISPPYTEYIGRFLHEVVTVGRGVA